MCTFFVSPYSALYCIFSLFKKRKLGKIIYWSSVRESGKEKNRLFVSQATKHQQSLIHHENARMPDSWVTDQPQLTPSSPRGAPLIRRVCSCRTAQLTSTVLMCVCLAEEKKKKRTGGTKAFTAENLLGEGNVLSGVREHSHTFSFLPYLPPLPRETLLFSPRQQHTGARHQASAAHPWAATGTCCAQQPRCCCSGSDTGEQAPAGSSHLQDKSFPQPRSATENGVSPPRHRPFCSLL